jgi:ABC-type oligopeptide transport system ATPase subunit
MYIETKGRWTTADRTKMKHVLASNPGVDIRMVFQNPNQRLSKTSKTTYEMYAKKLGIMHVAKKDMPEEWLAECLKSGEEPVTIKSFFT